MYRGEVYGTLGQDRIEKLEAIGMVWDSIRDISWQRYYAAAKAYYEEHGDLNVPSDYRGANGLDLSAWLQRMRTYRKSGIQSSYLMEERIAMLDEIGMIWSVPDYLWEENFAGALRFYRENGHLDIPADYCTPNGLKIGTWIRRQRALRAGKLTTGVPPTEAQIARLDEIGMIWKSPHETAWDLGYQAAVDYREQHGDLCVPTSYVTPEGYKLGAWIADRRERGKKQHSREQQRLLDDLGMVWEKPDSWEIRYVLAKQYFEKHGDLNIPSNYKVDGIWLAKWINEQRQIYIGNRGNKRLTEDQVRRLEAIGMTWENRNHVLQDDAWHSQYRAVQAFYEICGHLNIPSEYDGGKGKNLTKWITRQRAARVAGKLTDEQITLLDALGMAWIIEDPWEVGFRYATEYYTAHGNLLVSTDYICPDGFPLGNWISNQRSNAKTTDKYRKLDKEQIRRLESIGMIWDMMEFRWQEAYQRAAIFYRENGHLVVPKEDRQGKRMVYTIG